MREMALILEHGHVRLVFKGDLELAMDKFDPAQSATTRHNLTSRVYMASFKL